MIIYQNFVLGKFQVNFVDVKTGKKSLTFSAERRNIYKKSGEKKKCDWLQNSVFEKRKNGMKNRIKIKREME